MEMEGCFSAVGVRKGAWAREEDILLKQCIDKYGEGKWHLVPSRAGLNRCRKSCRLRWMNYLKPDIKRGDFSYDEVDLILRLHKLLGNRWSLIAGRIPGRTANDVKNYWNTHLRKKVVLSYDNNIMKPKNMEINDDQNIIIKSTVIKPRARTFKRKLNPKPIATSPEGPQNNNVPEESKSWWESLLLDNIDDHAFLNIEPFSDDIDNIGSFDFEVSEANNDVISGIGNGGITSDVELRNCWTDFMVDVSTNNAHLSDV